MEFLHALILASIFFLCKEMNFIVIERLIAIFLWKFSISCSLHEVNIGLQLLNVRRNWGNLYYQNIQYWGGKKPLQVFKIDFELK